MEFSKIEALKLLKNGSLTIHELASNIVLSYPRAAAIARELIKEGYCEKAGGRIALARSAKGSLFKALSDKYNPKMLLGGASERLLSTLTGPLEVHEIQRRTGLAQSTIYQTLRRLMAIGAVRKLDGRHAVVDDSDLKAFLDILRREREAAEVESYATIVRSNGFKLKRVPAGKSARGSLTAFSLFARHGVEYASPHDYYIEPAREVSIEDVLIHALVCSDTKADGTMCAVFYLKNIDRIDLGKTKALAKEFGVISLWVDLQSYAKGLPVFNVEKFLPWGEFAEKAKIYDVQVSPLPAAEKMTDALREIGETLDETIHAYLFGGANMLLRGLKKSTKDMDIVVGSREDFLKLRGQLLNLGFRPLGDKELTQSDKKLNPSGIYVADMMPRVDLFTVKICDALFLTDEVKARSEEMAFGKLVLHLLSLGDIFLLKSITEREGDLEDMAAIIRLGVDIEWGDILETYLEEEKVIKRHLCFTILDNIELLQERVGTAVPFHGALLRHCIEVGILQALAHGARDIKGIRELIDFPEHTIRNRVNKLAKEKKISKREERGHVVLAITDSGRELLFE